jgi:acyl-CoA thioesterase
VLKEIVTLQRLDENRWLGAPSPDRGAQTYGGHLLAQALAAAQGSVTMDRRVGHRKNNRPKPGDLKVWRR